MTFEYLWRREGKIQRLSEFYCRKSAAAGLSADFDRPGTQYRVTGVRRSDLTRSPAFKKLPFCKGRVPYFISSGLAILSTRTLDLEIEADGEIFSGRYCEVAFGNGNLLGGNFHFGGEADPTDGKMKMILVPGRGFFIR